jgi:hypothetical protein
MQAIIAEKNKKLAELRLKKEILELQHEIASRRNHHRNGGQTTEWRDSYGKSKTQTYLDKGSSLYMTKQNPERSCMTAKLDNKKTELMQCRQKNEMLKGDNNVENVDAKLARIEKNLKALLATQHQEVQSNLSLIQNKLKSQNAESLSCEVESMKRFTEQKLRESMLSVKQEFEYTSIHNIETKCVSMQDDFTQQLSEVKTELQQEFHAELEAVREYYGSELTRAKSALRDDFRKEIANVQLELEKQFNNKVEEMRTSQEAVTTMKLESMLTEVRQQNQLQLAYHRQLHKMELSEKLENFKVEWELRHKNLESKFQNVEQINVDQGKSSTMVQILEDSSAAPNLKNADPVTINLSEKSNIGQVGCLKTLDDNNHEKSRIARCIEPSSSPNRLLIEGRPNEYIERSAVEVYDFNILFSNARERTLGRRCVCRFLCNHAPRSGDCTYRDDETTSPCGHVDNKDKENAHETDVILAHQMQGEDVEQESCFSDDDMDLATMVDSFVEPDRNLNRLLQSHNSSENQDKVSLLGRFLTGSPKRCNVEELWYKDRSESSEEENSQFPVQEKYPGFVDQPTNMAETGDGCIEEVDPRELQLDEEINTAERKTASNVHDEAQQEVHGESNYECNDSESGNIELRQISNDQGTNDEQLANPRLPAVPELTSDQVNPDKITTIIQFETEKCTVQDRTMEKSRFSSDVQFYASHPESMEKQSEFDDSIDHVVGSTMFAENEDHTEKIDLFSDTALPTKSEEKPVVEALRREESEEHKLVLETDAIYRMVEADVSAAGKDESIHSDGESAEDSRMEVNSAGSGRQNSSKQLDEQDLSRSNSLDISQEEKPSEREDSEKSCYSISDPSCGEKPEEAQYSDLSLMQQVSTIHGIVSENLSIKHEDIPLESVNRNASVMDYHIFTPVTEEYILEHEVSDVEFDDDVYGEQEKVPYHTDFLHKLPVCDIADFNVAEATEAQKISFHHNNVENVVMNGNDDEQSPEVENPTTIADENIGFEREVSEVNSEDNVNPLSDQEENADPLTEERFYGENHYDPFTSTVDEDTCSYYSEEEFEEEEDFSSTEGDDGLVPAEELNIEDNEEMELRKRALALLGIGI